MTYWIAPEQNHVCRRCEQPITFGSTCVVGPDESGTEEPVMRFNFSCGSENNICYNVSFTTAKRIEPPDEWMPETFIQALEARP